MITVDIGRRNENNSELEHLLRLSQINVPTTVNSSKHELVNRPIDPNANQTARNLNPFAYQAYDKPSTFAVKE